MGAETTFGTFLVAYVETQRHASFLDVSEVRAGILIIVIVLLFVIGVLFVVLFVIVTVRYVLLLLKY